MLLIYDANILYTIVNKSQIYNMYVHIRAHMCETVLGSRLHSQQLIFQFRVFQVLCVLGTILYLLCSFRRCKSRGVFLEVAIGGRQGVVKDEQHGVYMGQHSISLNSLSYG